MAAEEYGNNDLCFNTQDVLNVIDELQVGETGDQDLDMICTQDIFNIMECDSDGEIKFNELDKHMENDEAIEKVNPPKKRKLTDEAKPSIVPVFPIYDSADEFQIGGGIKKKKINPRQKRNKVSSVDYNIQFLGKHYSEKSNGFLLSYSVGLKDNWMNKKWENYKYTFQRMLKNVLTEVSIGVNPAKDLIQLSISQSDLKIPVYIKFKPFEIVSPSYIMEQVKKVMHQTAEIRFNSTFNMYIRIVQHIHTETANDTETTKNDQVPENKGSNQQNTSENVHNDNNHDTFNEENGTPIRMNNLENALSDNSQDDDHPLVNFREKKRVFLKKFGVEEIIYEIKLNNELIGKKWNEYLHVLASIFETCIRKASKHLNNEQDLIRIYINQLGLRIPVILNLRPISEMTVGAILSEIEKILQSNDKIKFDESFEIHIATVEIVKGSGLSKKKISQIGPWADSKYKKCIINISRDAGHLCFARAVSVGLTYLAKNKKSMKNIRDNRYEQIKKARKLHKDIGLSLDKPVSLNDIFLFENYLNVQIKVVSASAFNAIVYNGAKERNVKLYVYNIDNHYNLIVPGKLNAFYGRSYYCELCDVGYNNKCKHKCSSTCNICYRSKSLCVKQIPFKCVDCNRLMFNKECYILHKIEKYNKKSKKRGTSTCDNYYFCDKCRKLVYTKVRKFTQHQCGEIFCSRCNVYYIDDTHVCYMKEGKVKPASDKYIFFDFETLLNDKNQHVPNFCVAHRTCSDCICIEDINTKCKKCLKRQHVFKGVDTLNSFCEWLFSRENKGYTCFAHNGSGFDFILILNYLLSHCIIPKVIYNGGKIMQIFIPKFKMKFYCSYNHIQTALRKFSDMFEIKETKKGFFPYKFNTVENQNYIGKMPDISFYDPDGMPTELRNEFIIWYQNNSTETYHHQRELELYCISDVSLLRIAMLRYKKMVELMTTKDTENQGIDPLQYPTVASVSMAIYKYMFLKPETIALVPGDGMIKRNNYSKKAIVWLEYSMKKLGIYIQNAMNSSEKIIGKYTVDGFTPPSDIDNHKGTVWEFNGCFYHSHNCKNPEITNKSGAYVRTMLKRNYLEKEGYIYRSIWECEFDKHVQEDPDLKNFCDNFVHIDRLNPRSSLFGGRTGSYCLHYEAQEAETIEYSDFCSLYPFICLTNRYVIGKPDVILKDFKDINEYTGFIKAKVIPPRQLYFPVLPMRCKMKGGSEKLLFPLCRTCAQNQLLDPCMHSDNERSITGTWTTMELQKSIEKGYKVEKVYEVYHFPKTLQYEKGNKAKETVEGLFSGYIKLFMKIKAESSGFPSYCVTEEEKQTYIQKYYEREGILLDYTKIRKNPGLRSLAKIFLNSLWGKFAQRLNLTQTLITNTPARFFGLLTDKTKTVKDFNIINEDFIMVHWQNKSEYITDLGSTNVYIAAFTTAQARLKLYDVMDKLGPRCLYSDTDSCVWISRDNEYKPEIGEYLGMLKNELKPGETILRGIFPGAKSYAFVTSDQNMEIRCKGFTLNHRNKSLINFDSFVSLVKSFDQRKLNERNKITTCNTNKICREKKTSVLYTKVESKDFKVCYDKRVIQSDGLTLPYGF